ncbi:type II toxin-antitoxin system RelE/ParE family toxin [Flammeovirga yaeyamensis]|uniref:Type II toxin-antitoxin system RelE/ParE family toxin n=1 Tax=Flammeovirga yaeyamensis TaxID=367791 RepID=A0AAX1NA70_9BACT|nr:type II toxin-antitoxin system RelE/ParE family toxin [Flammeovirga yaeyamensis]MBB3699491.1 toxin ParE1/3/4 [Flammeovirga yaeyamensis]NMF35252.1 type II toxin-antitoxin system RelE/ParE family toxin [Flammeovirga yaeyamensis]QWG04112.1 type II toxin-antitoxin system RelE/ParE family toxin [Flammeovirga yaeyamensis]
MANYKLSNVAKEDLIRIYRYGVEQFGEKQADKYFNSFERIAQRPFSYESVDYIKSGYRKCVSGVDSIYFRVINESVEIMTIIGKHDLEKL